MVRKVKIRIWIGGLLFALMIMAFMPNGSFMPKEVGFWTAIGAAVIWVGLMMLFLGRFQKNSNNENHTDL